MEKVENMFHSVYSGYTLLNNCLGFGVLEDIWHGGMPGLH